MITVGEFSIEEVLPFTQLHSKERKEYVCDGVSWYPKMGSQRYDCFRKSLACAKCGTMGVKFLLQMHEWDKQPHFNLFAEKDGELVLMTKDHIVPRSKGGTNYLSNLQTMCAPCNHEKGNDA
jgi:5-methylcytosine-specific restriction endonuclease McrA